MTRLITLPMQRRLAPLVALFLALGCGLRVWAGDAAEVPPSPSTVPGVRIWPAPAITHWPAVIYADEARNVAFGLPVRQPGVAGSIGWHGQPALPITLPVNLEQISGLLPLPTVPGAYQAELILAGQLQSGALQIRLVDAAKPWPQTALRDGFPVDAEGVPVVLIDHRRDANDERRWTLIASLNRPRPAGQALIVGDTMAALGDSPFNQLPAKIVAAVDETQPWHAQIVALATEAATWGGEPLKTGPRTIVWSPGNRALQANTWTTEEDRVFGLLRTRLSALEIYPRLVLILPPTPIDDREPVLKQAVVRRDHLRRAAAALGWIVLDAERFAGPSEAANQVAEHVYAPGPVGEARLRLRAAMAAELAR
jgi:hypothetical protein